MTLFGWDASHYDGLLSTTILARARGEGIAFFTHKIGEGTSSDDPNDKTALAAARDAGIAFIGGYYVVRTADITAQVTHCVQLADRDESWWRDFPGWFWQVDLERWPYDPVTAATGIAFAKALRARTGRQVILYASRGQYGDQLRDWDGPLWNANYPSSRQAGFKSLYPGDAGIGWTAYSGQTPVMWQYASTATIAGLTTCDANAFRGSVNDLHALTTPGGGSDVLTQDDIINIRNAVGDLVIGWISQGVDVRNKPPTPAGPSIAAVAADIVAIRTSESASLVAIQTVLQQVQATGGNLDAAPIIDAINASRDEAHQSFLAVAAENQQLRDEIGTLRQRLAQAAQAGAAALTDDAPSP